MEDVHAAAAAAAAALDTVQATDTARREQLGHLDQKLTRQLAHMDKGFAALGGQVDAVRASMSDMDTRVTTQLNDVVTPLQEGVHVMHAELGEQLMELETALDTVIEVLFFSQWLQCLFLLPSLPFSMPFSLPFLQCPSHCPFFKALLTALSSLRLDVTSWHHRPVHRRPLRCAPRR